MRSQNPTLYFALFLTGLFLITPVSAGGYWNITIADSTTDVGYFSSLAIGTDDCPAVSYQDYFSDDLKYAWNDGSGWQTSTIDWLGHVGSHTSLILDDGNHAAISYHNSTTGDLKYAQHDGANWQISTIDTEGDVGWFTSLAWDADGYPAVSYMNFSSLDLKYAWNKGTGWETVTVDSEDDVGFYSSLAFNATGAPAISYYDESNDDLKYARYDGTDWHISTIDTAGAVGKYCSLAFDATGAPAVSYYDESSNELKYARYDGADWQTSTIDTAGDVGRYCSLAYDTAGYPAVAYSVSTGGLKYAHFDGINWQISSIDTGVLMSDYISLAFDTDGHPAISYHDDANDYLKYASYTTTGDLQVTSVPAGAAIWIDGGDTGELTNDTFSLSTGDYDVNVLLAGYEEPAIQTITVPDGGTVNATFILVPLSGIVTIDVPLSAGWNMISVPVANATIIIPSEAGTVYRYNGNVYESVSDLTSVPPGEGLWISAIGPCTLSFTGTALDCYTKPAPSGWNMIGSCTTVVPFADHLVSVPEGAVSDQIYTYDPAAGTYVTPVSCTPGSGYWISANAKCEICIS